MDLTQASEQFVNQITQQLVANLQATVKAQVEKTVQESMRKTDLTQVAKDYIASYLNGNTQAYQFPERSIKGTAIDSTGLFVKPEQIMEGTFRNFQSSGIQDSATMCQVTILDQATVFENKLVAGKLEVAENATIKGDLKLTGTIISEKFLSDVTETAKAAVNKELQSGALEKIKKEAKDSLTSTGLSAQYVTVEGKPLVSEKKLAPGVLYSNIQTVGALKELQVIGETLLSNTLYTSGIGRVGINTIDPEYTLDMWDAEIQFAAFKQSQDVGAFGTTKPQQLVLTSNKKANLILNPDGSVAVANIKIGKINMSGEDGIPSADRPKGSIVWNTNPAVGSPIGWVSLGGARWAKFGTIQL